MRKIILGALLFSSLSISANARELQVTVRGFESGDAIPEKFARCVARSDNKSADGDNISPEISWNPGPEGTQSYAIIVVDRDALQKIDDRNVEGKKIVDYVPRQNFYHWMLVNIPANIYSIPEKDGRNKNYGDQLVNDFLKLTNTKPTAQNKLKFTGYDGPCPPWNDERVHNYHFKVYALSTRFNIGEENQGDDIVRKIAPYVLATGEVVGTYTLNPDYLPKPAAKAPETKTEVKTDAKGK